MAKNDYFVIIYKILAYLYVCLKEGENPDMEYLAPNSKMFPVNEKYWNYIFEQLHKDEYVEGVALMPIIGQTTPGVKITQNIRITPKGIEYLQENGVMQKTKEFLKEIKDVIPGL